MEMPGEKLVIKLWETVAEKGIGGLFRPWQIRREGRASLDVRREEILMLAQAERDAESIRRGELLPPEAPSQGILLRKGSESGALEQRVSEMATADFVRREVNVTRALLHAEEVLERDSQDPPDAPVDEDWLFRWRDSASQVSQEQLQNLWGRVLAGEVKAPGSYSLRTLEFLKNLSQGEAEDIGKLAPLVVAGLIYRSKDNELSEFGVDFDFLLRMQGLGIIAGVEAIGMTTNWQSGDKERFLRALVSGSHVLIVSADDPSKKLTLPSFVVTDIGAQVLSLGNPESNVLYLRKVGQQFKAQGFSVKIAKYEKVDEKNIRPIGGEDL